MKHSTEFEKASCELGKISVSTQCDLKIEDLSESEDCKIDSSEKIISSTLDLCLQDVFSFSPIHSYDYDDL